MKKEYNGNKKPLKKRVVKNWGGYEKSDFNSIGEIIQRLTLKFLQNKGA